MKQHLIKILSVLASISIELSPANAKEYADEVNIDKLAKIAYCISNIDDNIEFSRKLCGITQCKERGNANDEYLKHEIDNLIEQRRRMVLYVVMLSRRLPSDLKEIITHSKKLGFEDIKRCQDTTSARCGNWRSDLSEREQELRSKCQAEIPVCAKVQSCEKLEMPF